MAAYHGSRWLTAALDGVLWYSIACRNTKMLTVVLDDIVFKGPSAVGAFLCLVSCFLAPPFALAMVEVEEVDPWWPVCLTSLI